MREAHSVAERQKELLRGSIRQVRSLTARYKRQRSRTPFSSCSPASSKTRPEPATRSLTVLETNTSLVRASAATRAPTCTAIPLYVVPRELDLAGVTTRPDLQADCSNGLDDRLRASDRTRVPVERGEQSVAGRVDVASSVPLNLPLGLFVVGGEQLLPAGVSQPRGRYGRADDVNEQHRREHAIGFGYVANTCQEFLDLADQCLRLARPGEVVGAGQLDEATVRDLRGEQAVTLRNHVLRVRTEEHKGRNADGRQDGSDVGPHVQSELGFVALGPIVPGRASRATR